MVIIGDTLMECLVFARKMSLIVLNDLSKVEKFDRSFQDFDIEDPKEDQISIIAEKIDELRKLCWLNLGVSRNKVNMLSLIHI